MNRLAALLLLGCVGYTLPALASEPHLIRHYISQAASRYHSLPHFREVLTGIIAQESSYCRYMTSRIDSLANGCGGIHAETAYEVTGIRFSRWMLQHNDQLNINITAAILNYCARKYGSRDLALTCFHQGQYWNNGVDQDYVSLIDVRIAE